MSFQDIIAEVYDGYRPGYYLVRQDWESSRIEERPVYLTGNRSPQDSSKLEAKIMTREGARTTVYIPNTNVIKSLSRSEAEALAQRFSA